jgi:hypothetical protein
MFLSELDETDAGKIASHSFSEPRKNFERLMALELRPKAESTLIQTGNHVF